MSEFSDYKLSADCKTYGYRSFIFFKKIRSIEFTPKPVGPATLIAVIYKPGALSELSGIYLRVNNEIIGVTEFWSNNEFVFMKDKRTDDYYSFKWSDTITDTPTKVKNFKRLTIITNPRDLTTEISSLKIAKVGLY